IARRPAEAASPVELLLGSRKDPRDFGRRGGIGQHDQDQERGGQQQQGNRQERGKQRAGDQRAPVSQLIAAAKSCHWSGTPFRAWIPRSRNVSPDPTTRSLMVRETRTSPVPASAAMRAPIWMATPSTSSPTISTSPVCRPARI